MTVCYLETGQAGVETFPWLEDDTASTAQGDEGRRVHENMRDAVRHWNARTERLLTSVEEELTYEPVPPKAVKTVRVKYRFVGQARPLLYRLDESSP